jgi:hypothetical protein
MGTDIHLCAVCAAALGCESQRVGFSSCSIYREGTDPIACDMCGFEAGSMDCYPPDVMPPPADPARMPDDPQAEVEAAIAAEVWSK